MTQMYFARRPFGYGDGEENQLDPGQVVELKGYSRDEQLRDLGYFGEVSKGTSIVGCGKCGRQFASDAFLSMHGTKRHPRNPRTAEQEEAFIDSEDKKLSTMLPLNLGQTAASRGLKPRGRRAGV